MLGLDEADPRTVGEYTILGKLGEGGMGRVYQGRSPGGRVVAVKVARPELAADPAFRSRFRSEIDAARRVGGFHTAQVVDADGDANPPWLVTAYVPGPSLADLIRTDGPMDELNLRKLGAALAEALRAIHACGLVHRDLKPSNIIMAGDGPRVLDFGIAYALQDTRLTGTNMLIGTPGYLAPEQIQDQAVGPACDVFALGAVLVHAAGGAPFGTTGGQMAMLYRTVHDAPDLELIPPAMRPTVAGCLAKDPAQRPTPTELLAAFGLGEPPGMTRTSGADGTPATQGGPRSSTRPEPPTMGPASAPTRREAPPLVRPGLPPTRIATGVTVPDEATLTEASPADPRLVFEAARTRRRLAAVPLFVVMVAVTAYGVVVAMYTPSPLETRILVDLVVAIVDLVLLVAVLAILGDRRSVTIDRSGLTVRHRGFVARRELVLPWHKITAVDHTGQPDRLRLRVRLRGPVDGPPRIPGVRPLAYDLVEVEVPWPPAAGKMGRMLGRPASISDYHPDNGARIIGQTVRRYAPAVGTYPR